MKGEFALLVVPTLVPVCKLTAANRDLGVLGLTSGCVNLADGKDELCSTHRAALAGLESLGHTTARWLDTETGQWGWECAVCPAVHAAVLSFAGADAGAEKHRQETKR